MSQESRTATFSAPSSSDVDVQVLNKGSKISYTREFLLSLDKVDSIVKFPLDSQTSILCVVDDASGLLSSPLCVPDFRFKRSEPQFFSLKVPDDANQLLHKTDEPYRPPCRYKALPSSTRDSNDLLNGDAPGSECTNQEMANREIWRKDTDSNDSPDEFLMSPASRNSMALQFTSSVISKQLDASKKLSQIHRAVRRDAGLPPRLQETAKKCPTPPQLVQDLTTNETVNSWLETVNDIDTSWHLSMMDDCMHLMESEECPDLVEENLEGTAHVMKSLKKSMPLSFLSEEHGGNHNNNNCEMAYEFTKLQLNNTSVTVYDSPRRISMSDPTQASISPMSVEEKKQFVSMIDDCESSTVCCKGISVSMKQNPPCRDFQIHQKLELNSFSCSLDGESDSSSELCLPDEDSLITFDELFFMPDVDNLAVVDSSMSSSPLKNPIEADVFSPSSPREMVEKLVEFILGDESSTDDPILHHGAGLERFALSMHAQLTPRKLCSNQLNPEKDPQDYNKFQRNSIDSTIYSFFSHSFPFNTFSQPFPLYQDELIRFDHEVSQTMLQQIISPNKLHCSLSVSQSGVPPHLPALQRASCTQRLNSMQTCPFAYQEPKHNGDFIRPNPDFQGDSNINPALVDSFIQMKLRASHWQPHVPGF